MQLARDSLLLLGGGAADVLLALALQPIGPFLQLAVVGPLGAQVVAEDPSSRDKDGQVQERLARVETDTLDQDQREGQQSQSAGTERDASLGVRSDRVDGERERKRR